MDTLSFILLQYAPGKTTLQEKLDPDFSTQNLDANLSTEKPEPSFSSHKPTNMEISALQDTAPTEICLQNFSTVRHA